MVRLLVLILAIFLSRLAQSQTTPAFSSTAEIGGFVSSSRQVPFWLRANQWGTVPLPSPIGTARVGAHYLSHRTHADSTHRKPPLHWEFGAEGIANAGKTSQLLLPEAYAKLHWKQLELLVGRERQIIGIVDSTLSSGSYSWSGNALPVPMARLGFSDYVPFSFLKNFISIKGSFAHGWFWDTYIRKSYLHQKTLYGRFGKPEGNVHVEVGMVHHVMWGGEADYLVNNPVAVNGKLTSTFQNYVLGVVLAQIPKEKANGQITTFDGVNRIGNHLGHYDFALDWRIRNIKFTLYRQHPFEDASGLQFQNLPDGLSGLSLRRRVTSSSFFSWQGLVFEYLVTKDQTGDDFTIPGSRFTGGDAYFNHVQYIEGWSYKGSGLGTPLIPNKYEVREGVPLNNLFFPTNRIILYHLGLEGLLAQKVRVLLKISNSQHYPSALTPRTDPMYRQFSSLLSLDAPLARWGSTRLKAQIAYDKGDVLPNSFGGYLGIKTYLRN
jgi:hypothetical protein